MHLCIRYKAEDELDTKFNVYEAPSGFDATHVISSIGMLISMGFAVSLLIFQMGENASNGFESPRPRSNLLRDQVQLVKRKDSDRCEIVPIDAHLKFEKGFFVVIRACQLLAQNNEGIILVGVAGPSGAGKTVFTEKMLNFMPSIAVISMDNYNDSSRIIDGNFDGTPLNLYSPALSFDLSC